MEENKEKINANCCSGEEKEKCECKKFSLPEKYFEVMPAADIADDENGAELFLEVPGANAGTVNVEVKDRILSITAASTLYRHSVPVVYKRDFRLSDAVEISGIGAVTKDGLLTITLPKSERAKVHRIPVR
ncbi:MAG: Hsp20/alpha crystallin family protein [Lentisphaeria bacterium]|nr:Hsp20/alpha crystallin family protein [Lentisphaeria bacterium]